MSRDGHVRWDVETHAAAGLDLDGHGSPVVLVPPAGAGLHPDNMHWTIYVMRGECGHELGVIDGMEDPTPEPGESRGLRNISTLRPVWPESSGGRRGNLVLTHYAFDGRRYRAQRPGRR